MRSIWVKRLQPDAASKRDQHLLRRRPCAQKVTLEVKRGEAVALLGRNGMGKTNYPALYYGTDTGQERLDPTLQGEEIAAATATSSQSGG